jgi:hypothetical protein
MFMNLIELSAFLIGATRCFQLRDEHYNDFTAAPNNKKSNGRFHRQFFERYVSSEEEK